MAVNNIQGAINKINDLSRQVGTIRGGLNLTKISDAVKNLSEWQVKLNDQMTVLFASLTGVVVPDISAQVITISDINNGIADTITTLSTLLGGAGGGGGGGGVAPGGVAPGGAAAGGAAAGQGGGYRYGRYRSKSRSKSHKKRRRRHRRKKGHKTRSKRR